MPQRIEVPGMGVVEFPDGMTDDQIVAAIKANMPAQDNRPPLMRRMQELVAGGVRGAGSIGATLLTPYDLLAGNTKSIGSPERRQAMDDAFGSMGVDTDSPVYSGGKLGAEIAGTMGVGGALGKGVAAAAPRMAPLAEALTTGGFKVGGMTGPAALGVRTVGGTTTGLAAAGLVNPDDAGTGALVGGALPGATKAAGLVGRAGGALLRPDSAKVDLARAAVKQYDIPLSLSDVSGNAFIKGTRSALDDVPIIGRIGGRQAGNMQSAYNRAVGRVLGESADILSPQVMDSAKTRIGGNLSKVWDNNTLKLDGAYIQKLQDIQSQAATKLNPEQAAQVDRLVQNLLGKVDANGEVAGAFANNWQSELRMVADSEKGLHKKVLSELRKATLDAFKRSIPADQADDLSKALQQYRAFKTVQPIMDKANLGVAGRASGDVPAALLPEAVRQSYGGAASPFGELPQIGSQFVADRVARTGGSARAMVQNSALGTGLALGAWNNPLIPLLGLPVAAATEGLLSSPAAARMLLGAQQPSAAANLLAPYLYRAAPVLAGDR